MSCSPSWAQQQLPSSAPWCRGAHSGPRMTLKQLSLCHRAASTHWQNRTLKAGGKEGRDYLGGNPLSQPAAELAAHPPLGIPHTLHSPPCHHTPILAQTARPPRHKLLCWRLHQPRFEKSLNPQARVSSNPSGAVGLPALPNPPLPGARPEL